MLILCHVLIKIKVLRLCINFEEHITTFFRTLSCLCPRHIGLHCEDLAECFVAIWSIDSVLHLIRPEDCMTPTRTHLQITKRIIVCRHWVSFHFRWSQLLRYNRWWVSLVSHVRFRCRTLLRYWLTLEGIALWHWSLHFWIFVAVSSFSKMKEVFWRFLRLLVAKVEVRLLQLVAKASIFRMRYWFLLQLRFCVIQIKIFLFGIIAVDIEVLSLFFDPVNNFLLLWRSSCLELFIDFLFLLVFHCEFCCTYTVKSVIVYLSSSFAIATSSHVGQLVTVAELGMVCQ